MALISQRQPLVLRLIAFLGTCGIEFMPPKTFKESPQVLSIECQGLAQVLLYSPMGYLFEMVGSDLVLRSLSGSLSRVRNQKVSFAGYMFAVAVNVACDSCLCVPNSLPHTRSVS